MAWTEKSNDRKTHILYLAADGDIYANPDSSYLFANYEQPTTADFSHLKTNLVTNMSNMFHGCTNPKQLDVSNWDVSSVTDMGFMFVVCAAVNSMKTGSLSSWNLNPNVTMHNFCKGTKFENNPLALFR